MIHRRPIPEETLPGQVLLSTGGTGNFDPGRLLEVFGEQRQRFTSVPATGLPRPGAPSGPRTTSSATCATAP
jgi:hypothetical protein